MSKINQIDRARLAWTVLTRVAKKRDAITYGELGAEIGVHHRAIRFVLSPIQDYCMEMHLNPLTILVVNASHRRPGSGFVASAPNDFESALEAVWGHRWTGETNPFDFAAAGLSYETLIGTLTKEPDSAATVYAAVKSRGVQQIVFREAVRKAYSWRCAFTGLCFPDALEACHIVPWANATPQQRMDVRNGLLLNPLHHRFFDIGRLTITEDYLMHYSDPLSETGVHSSLEAALTLDLHHQKMNAPYHVHLRPLTANIRQHNERMGWSFS